MLAALTWIPLEKVAFAGVAQSAAYGVMPDGEACREQWKTVGLEHAVAQWAAFGVPSGTTRITPPIYGQMNGGWPQSGALRADGRMLGFLALDATCVVHGRRPGSGHDGGKVPPNAAWTQAVATGVTPATAVVAAWSSLQPFAQRGDIVVGAPVGRMFDVWLVRPDEGGAVAIAEARVNERSVVFLTRQVDIPWTPLAGSMAAAVTALDPTLAPGWGYGVP